jgi:hypothetical protein
VDGVGLTGWLGELGCSMYIRGPSTFSSEKWGSVFYVCSALFIKACCHLHIDFAVGTSRGRYFKVK